MKKAEGMGEDHWKMLMKARVTMKARMSLMRAAEERGERRERRKAIQAHMRPPRVLDVDTNTVHHPHPGQYLLRNMRQCSRAHLCQRLHK